MLRVSEYFAKSLKITHSLTAALDQLRVVASSTSNDPGPRSRQHQQIGQRFLPLAAANFSVDDPAGASSQQREECRAAGGVPSSGRSATQVPGGVPLKITQDSSGRSAVQREECHSSAGRSATQDHSRLYIHLYSPIW